MKAVRAALCEESGVAVRKNRGNLRRSLSVGDVEPKETSGKMAKKSNFLETIKILLKK